MDHIKQYNDVDRSNESKHFRITRIEDYYSERSGEPDVPHRHNYYTILVANKAKGKHIIDFNNYTLGNNQIYFIGPGQVHQVIEEEQSFGYSIVFSDQFLIKNHIPTSFLFNLNLFNNHGASPFLNANNLDEINEYCSQLVLVQKEFSLFQEDMASSYLKLILIQCSTILHNVSSGLQANMFRNSLFNEFRKLVETHFAKWHSVQDYANELNVSTDHLNRIIKSLNGKTTKQYIHSRIFVETKRMLYFTDLSNKEIAYQLGFSEPSHFSAFVKKQSGTSPKSFRKHFLNQ